MEMPALILSSGPAFEDPDPGNQNLVDPTDPDSKHWFKAKKVLHH